MSRIPYLGVLRTNSKFRRLWLGQVVSQLGDWFNSIALYTLVLKLTGSGEALGLLVAAQFLPATVTGFFSGPLLDRFSRKRLMLVSDLLRAVLVLGFLWVDRPDRIAWLYAITVLMVICQGFFEPARSAILPDVVSREEMVPANAIAGATWSTMLALGAALGGLVSGLLGLTWGFILNSISFLASAGLIASLDVTERGLSTKRTGWKEGFVYLWRHREVAVYAGSKACWGLGGGIALVLTFYGESVFPMGLDGAISIGLFYAARGVGAGFGPFLAYGVGGTSTAFLRRALVPGFLLGACGYSLLGYTDSFLLALGCVVLAHLGGATQWVFSTSLLQLTLPDHIRGRIFSLEYATLTLTISISSVLVGKAQDLGWSAPELAQTMGLSFLTGAFLMTLGLLLTRPCSGK